MALKRVDERLSRLTSMVEKWNMSGDVPRIERDMALEELRRIYDELLDYNPQSVVDDTAPSVDVVEGEAVNSNAAVGLAESVMPSDIVTPVESVGDAFDDALDIDAILGLSGDDSISIVEPNADDAIETEQETEPQQEAETEQVSEPHQDVESATVKEVEPEQEPEIEQEPEQEPEPQQNIETEQVSEVEQEPETEVVENASERPVGGGLFDMDDIPVRTKGGRRMISLYDVPKGVTPAAEPVVEHAEVTTIVAPQPAPEPREEGPQRLGDVIAKNVTTLADKMAEEQPTAAFNRITDIRKAIGLNDRFLMIRDLFGGDATLYDKTITRLNEFDDLDECMIYIVENFRWNPDSEGAKLLVSLLERKLS